MIVEDNVVFVCTFYMFYNKKLKFIANSKNKSFHILVQNNVHIMTLKYDKFKFDWAAVTEKKH